MIKQEYFYHEQTPEGKSLGFSARFVPATGTDEVNQFGERMVWMNTTRCNPKDKHFNKKIARSVLRYQKPLVLVRCKDVPKLLAGCYNECYGYVYFNEHSHMRILKKFL